MTKKYIIELPASFEVPKYDGRVKYIAVPVRKIHEAKEIAKDLHPEMKGKPVRMFVVEE